jgi:hypothetical protein
MIAVKALLVWIPLVSMFSSGEKTNVELRMPFVRPVIVSILLKLNKSGYYEKYPLQERRTEQREQLEFENVM